MRRQLLPALLMLAVMTVVVGIAYPLAVLAVSQTAFGDKANGSIIERDGQAVGSALLGQTFTADRYFWPRPSAAGATGYDGLASSPSNLGPSNEKLIADCYATPGATSRPGEGPRCDPNTVPQRVRAYRAANNLSDGTPVPIDAVTSSGSGLDPHISVANARLQAGRVATARGVPVEAVLAAVDAHTSGRPLGVLGEAGVNVLELNVALDQGGN